MKKSKIYSRETIYGFEYGSAKVERFASDYKKGWVTIRVQTPKHKLPYEAMQIYVTKTGKIRIYDSNGEWKPPEKTK
jgi:hypothetical protein